MYGQQKRNIIHMSSTAYEQDHSAAAEQRDEVAKSQFIKWHSPPVSQGRIAGYRIGHGQAAAIRAFAQSASC
jgi:hypothetical protein